MEVAALGAPFLSGSAALIKARASAEASGLPALALAGRVPVKVTLEGGAIRPGDLQVSASLKGHAKRASGAVLPGTVIGKALQSHAEGSTGLVEMLVMTR